jgi:hypothetical protein
MNEHEPELPEDAQAAGVIVDGEVLDTLPVLAEEVTAVQAQVLSDTVPDYRRSATSMIPAVQAAAVAAGGFVAGVAVVGLVHRRQRRASALAKGRGFGRDLGRSARGRRAGELLQIVGSRSFLVDVHLLGGPGPGADG